MSIEANRTDFEKALEESKETIELLRHCVDDALLETLDKVISEYENHYSRDINELMDKAELLENQVIELGDMLDS